MILKPKNWIVLDMVNTYAQSVDVSLFNFQNLDITNPINTGTNYTYYSPTTRTSPWTTNSVSKIQMTFNVNGVLTHIIVGDISSSYTKEEVVDLFNEMLNGGEHGGNPVYDFQVELTPTSTNSAWALQTVGEVSSYYELLYYGKYSVPLVIYSAEYLFTQSTASDFIPNTPVSIQVSGDYSYSELMSELMVHPYKFETISIYADTLSQMSKTLELNSKEANGIKKVKLNFPAVDPTQKQFVKEDVPINFFPNYGSSIDFTMDASQSLRFIFKYQTVISYDFLEANSIEPNSYLSRYKQAQEKLKKDLLAKKTANKDNIKTLFGW